MISGDGGPIETHDFPLNQKPPDIVLLRNIVLGAFESYFKSRAEHIKSLRYLLGFLHKRELAGLQMIVPSIFGRAMSDLEEEARLLSSENQNVQNLQYKIHDVFMRKINPEMFEILQELFGIDIEIKTKELDDLQTFKDIEENPGRRHQFPVDHDDLPF